MKFNFSLSAKGKTVNSEGAKAYVLTPEMELYAAIATTMLADTTYEKEEDRLVRIVALMQQVDPRFVAKLAIYARKDLNLRTAPVVLATELAKIHSGDSLVSNTIGQIVQRPDEITEMLAYYGMSNKRTGTKKLNKISKQVQKGLAMSFNKFDAYQFAKYNRDGAVKLRDALFLVHPKAKDEAQQEVFDKIVTGELETPYTWETELSAVGQQHFENEAEKRKAVTATWEKLIDSRKLGYMALLRNLRNILEAGVSGSHMQMVCDFLGNETAVRNSKQLPFRFLAAYREVKALKVGHVPYVLDALEKAVRMTVANIKGFDPATRVVIACDVSGSMQKAVSPKSKVLLYDIGLLLGMLLQSRCKHVLTGMFGDFWKTVSLPAKQVLANVDAFYKREGSVGYSTNGYRVLQDLVSRRYVADKVMMFTDAQMWDSHTGNKDPYNTLSYQWAAYKKIAPAARLYLFDLSGYGNTPVKTEGDVTMIAGWSDKIFGVLEAVEHGAAALEMIEKIVL